MAFDLQSNVRRVTGIAPAVLSTDTAATVDLRDFKSCAVDILTGVGGITFTGTNRIDFVVEHSDDNSNWTAVTQADLIGLTVAGTVVTATLSNGIVRSHTAAHASASACRFGYRRTRRHLRVTGDFGGTHSTGTPIAVTFILGDPISAPVVQGA
jgi:hypothetical protein